MREQTILVKDVPEPTEFWLVHQNDGSESSITRLSTAIRRTVWRCHTSNVVDERGLAGHPIDLNTVLMPVHLAQK